MYLDISGLRSKLRWLILPAQCYQCRSFGITLAFNLLICVLPDTESAGRSRLMNNCNYANNWPNYWLSAWWGDIYLQITRCMLTSSTEQALFQGGAAGTTQSHRYQGGARKTSGTKGMLSARCTHQTKSNGLQILNDSGCWRGHESPCTSRIGAH